ncbi:DnaT-like ssDNA-binding domain-containing protein [Pseudomonas donghuensis]|uniref:DnaT-like ssDNA-binding domain-containing protein n=1 Tax=Pseudomonas donghuensis TaxID=1163398 RepID=UPI00215F6FAA|nr:DnaT-like ssDNA-binding domain-containing protein [Pseudomonas donghuensis]UVL22410.1 hypothetical protein LOY30_16240 [Pseudomonas donghuensis]
MIAIRLDQSEWDLLAGEPAELLKLYCALKRRMDFSTGIAGRKTLLNELVLREGFTVDPIRGRATPKPVTREQYRSAVRRLEALGLLRSLGPLVFEFLHARSDRPSKTFTTDLQPAEQPDQQPSGDDLEPNESVGFGELSVDLQPDQQPHYSPINNLLPESGKSTSTGNARGAFAMPLTDWEPEPKSFKAFAFANSVPANALTPEILAAFRTYWHVRPEREQTQAQWEQQLVSHLKHQLRQAQAGGYTHGSSKANANPQRAGGQAPGGQGGGHQRPDRSAPGRVRAAIAERQQREQAAAATAGQALAQDDGDVRAPLDVEFRRIS